MSAYPATPGEGAQDLWQNLWDVWWARTALLRGVNPFFTDMLFYPQGASLLFHPLNLTAGYLAIPFDWLAGPVFAYNTLVLLSFILSGYALSLLARRYGCGRWAGLVGGLAYLAAAFHFAHLRLGHFEQIAMQWLPLYALALDSLQRRPSLARGLALALALLALFFTSLYMAVYAVLFTGLWGIWLLASALRRGEWRDFRALLPYLLGACLLVLAITGPVLLVPMAREAQQASYMNRSIADAARGSAAPLDALLPPTSHPLRALVALPAPNSQGAFLGFLPLTLALYSLWARPRQAAFWLLLALLAWLLSLGPQLFLYRWLYVLPPLQVARYPDRFALLVLLGVALAAAIGAQALCDRMRGRWRWVGATLLLGLLLFELHPRGVPLTTPVDNPFYHQLARDPQRSSVFELPINRFNNVWVDMAAQTIHGKPIVYGALARDVPRIPLEWLPLIRELEYPARPRDILIQPQAARLAALRFFQIGYLIYHRADENGPVTPPSASSLSQVAGVPVREVYSDASLVGYQLDVPAGAAALPPFGMLDSGWYPLEPGAIGLQRWLRGAAGSMQLYAPTMASVRLHLQLLAYHQPRQLAIWLDGQQIGVLAAQPWPTEVETAPFRLTPGIHTVRLVPQEPGTTPSLLGQGNDLRTLTVALFAIEIKTDD